MAKKPRVPRSKKECRTLTPEDHDFIRQILASPDDDAPRLAYADWLERQGDGDRGEFIRCQVEAARLRPADPRRQQLDARGAVLLQAHQDECPNLADCFRWGPAASNRSSNASSSDGLPASAFRSEGTARSASDSSSFVAWSPT